MQLHKNPENSQRSTSGGGCCSIPKVCLLLFCAAAGFVLSAFDISGLSLDSVGTVMKGDDTYGTAKVGETKAERTVKQISILGERESGTRWTFGHISECFNHSVKVTSTFTRYKHWFQFPDYKRYKHDTLVITQFRNPYTWLKAMQKVPHHSPAHIKYRNDKDWRRFLTKEWTMERIGTDRWPNHTEPCQQFFEWKDLISCQRVPVPKEEYKENKYSNYQPFYEMRNDGSGKPYDNIMELRTDKIRNFINLKDYEGVVDAWTIQYEYLVKKGTKEMIDQIAKVTGVQPKCKPYPAQDRKARSINADMVGYINRHLNWTVESWIGYEQETV